jgi:transcriptional regulator with XRE-family HTH domain
MIARIRSSKPVRHFLREWRIAKGKTQQQLADLIDTSKGQVSSWESQRRGMTMEVQTALAYALGIEPQDLFRDPEQPSADQLLKSATPEKRREVFTVIHAMLGTGTSGPGFMLLDEDGGDLDTELALKPEGSARPRTMRK